MGTTCVHAKNSFKINGDWRRGWDSTICLISLFLKASSSCFCQLRPLSCPQIFWLYPDEYGEGLKSFDDTILSALDLDPVALGWTPDCLLLPEAANPLSGSRLEVDHDRSWLELGLSAIHQHLVCVSIWQAIKRRYLSTCGMPAVTKSTRCAALANR